MLKLNPENQIKPIVMTVNGNLKFDPPVYEQRYSKVVQILEHDLWKGTLKKVVDFGCGEMKLFQILKNVPGVEEVVAIDIDEDLLLRYGFRVTPLLADYLKKRETPFQVDVYAGSIDESHECLKNADAIIGIEVIEHVYPNVLEKLPHNIFGYAKPKVVIFTTPNYEFNVLFGKTPYPNGFRHEDHKFEWTRAQFYDWCYHLCCQYPDYDFEIFGIGPGPRGTEHFGCVTQMVVFVRKDVLYGDSNCVTTESLSVSAEPAVATSNYKLLFSHKYPVYFDDRDRNQKILDEAKYHIRRYRNMQDEFYDPELGIYRIPLTEILDLIAKETNNMDELKCILKKNNFRVTKEDILVITDRFDDEEEDDNDDEEQQDWNYDGAQKPAAVTNRAIQIESEEEWT